MKLPKNMARFGVLSLFAAAFIWGSSFVMMKDIAEKLPPSLLLALRFTIACVALSVLFFPKLKLLNRAYVRAGLYIGLSLFAAHMFQTYGLIGTTPGKNAFLTASYCIITPFLFWAVSKKKPSARHLLSATICLAGIFLISIRFGGDSFVSIGLGDALTLLCGIFYAAQIVAIEQLAKDKDTILITILQFGVVAILSWITFFILSFLGVATITATTADLREIVSQLLYLALACTALAIFLQNFGQRYANPSAAAIILTFEAVFGALFSILLKREEGFGVWRAVGFCLMFVSVLISQTKFSFWGKKRIRSRETDAPREN